MENLLEFLESLGYETVDLGLGSHVPEDFLLDQKYLKDWMSVDPKWRERFDTRVSDFHRSKDDEAFRLFSEDEINF